MANGGTSGTSKSPGLDAELLKALQWRCIGPHRGGRTVAVAGDPVEPAVFYFGACGGGVWKTWDGGTYWKNVSDGFFKTASVGAIAVAESDRNVVYAGMGEACIRGNVSHGDGVYRSTDGGKTWAHVGLEDTRHISRVRVHPSDPDHVYVAALGHAFGPNEQRGVFRTQDGGRNWDRVLYRSEKAGAADLSIDPGNPRVMYAAIWEALRQPWTLTSGGPDSSLYRSADGGDTWTEITYNPGLPEGLRGRMGVAASPARADRVWAVIESAEVPGLYRSDDGGDKWELVSDDRSLVQRPWYYSHVFADPTDAETVYVLNMKALKSTDGGRTFTQVPTPHGDNHDLWIDPQNTQRMIEGNDGGACVSFNGGDSWSTIYNQPTSQFYHMTTDNQFPYRVYGTQQDNSAISVPSRSFKGAIPLSDSYTVGSSESGHIAVTPDNPNIVYSGAIGSSPGGGDSLLRYDHSTGQTRIVSVWPERVRGWGPKDHKYRFQWTYPILISQHDPDLLYVAANMVFRSRSEGSSWEAISPDLTRADVSKMEPSGGPITLDTTFVEHYGTIFALAESPHEAGLLWAGSDDGLVHLSRDAGESWSNVTPEEIPEWTRIDTISVSPHDPATAYVSATRYKFDDFRPFLYKTKDYGSSWTRISDGIPEDDFTRVVREDPERPGLLYAGTETGVYVSADDGASWQSLRLDLPAVPVTDLAVKGDELVVSTNGRSFWILGGLGGLRQLADEAPDGPVQLLKPAPAYRVAPDFSPAEPTAAKSYMLGLGEPASFYETEGPNHEKVRKMLDAGADAPHGVVVTYFLKDAPEGEVTLSILDSEGRDIKSFSSKEETAPPGLDIPEDKTKELTAPAKPGMNRFVWNMRYPDAVKAKGPGAYSKGLQGPLAPSGEYQVRLSVGGSSQTQRFELLKDPRTSATQDDLQAQFDLLIRVRDKISETHGAINEIRSVTAQIDEWESRAEGESSHERLAKAASDLKEKLATIEIELIEPQAGDGLDTVGLPSRLDVKLAELSKVPGTSDHPPTTQTYEVFDRLSGMLDVQLQRLRELLDGDLAAFTALLGELGVPAIAPKQTP